MATNTAQEELVNDPNEWLEDVSGEQAMQWVAERNQATETTLAAAPRYNAIMEDAARIMSDTRRLPVGSLIDGNIYNFWRDENNPRGLWRRTSLDSYRSQEPEWETLLDIDKLAEQEGENWVFKGATASPPPSRRFMLQLSRGGSDAAVYREFCTEKLAFVDDGFQLAEAKSMVSWLDADTLLVGTDFGEHSLTTSGYPRIVKAWQRGLALDECDVLFEGNLSDVSVNAFAIHRPEGATVFAVRSTKIFEAEYYVLVDGEFQCMPLPRRCAIVGVFDGRAIVHLQEPWKYKGKAFELGSVVEFDIETGVPELLYMPGAAEAVQGVVATRSDVYVHSLRNVEGTLSRLSRTRSGWTATTVPLPGNGVLAIVSASSYEDGLIVLYENPVTPQQLYLVEPSAAVECLRSSPGLFDATEIVVERREATSNDGTRVPFFVIGKEDAICKGDAPVHLYAYGGFQVPSLPAYDPVLGKVWLEQGGIHVIAGIRGGGEFGPDWHQAALGDKRQNAYDDFYAVADALIGSGMTTPAKLGISGASNGGLLMGVAVTQRPDLFGAVVILVPLLDMLRFHQLLAGASWIGEYGNPEIARERKFLAQISPYHNLDEDVDYPDVLLYTSTKDDRVHPGHARKFAAKMKSQGHRALYYENTEGGHAGAANFMQQAKRVALQFTFLGTRLGMD